MIKATQGGRGFFQFIILKSNSVTKGSLGRSQKAGTCRQELRQTLWKNTAFWLAPRDTCSLLHPRITHAKVALLTVSWGLKLAGLFQETWVVCHSPLLGVRVGHFYKWKVMSQVLQWALQYSRESHVGKTAQALLQKSELGPLRNPIPLLTFDLSVMPWSMC